MIKTLKLLILPTIIVALFALTYYIILPYAHRRSARTNFFNNFENGLTSLNVDFTKNVLDADEYGALMGYEYISNEKKIIVYIFGRDSKEFKNGVNDGYIVSNKHSDTKLYGVYKNDCVLFMEDGFPNDTSILNMFMGFSQDYSNVINS